MAVGFHGILQRRLELFDVGLVISLHFVESRELEKRMASLHSTEEIYVDSCVLTLLLDRVDPANLPSIVQCWAAQLLTFLPFDLETPTN